MKVKVNEIASPVLNISKHYDEEKAKKNIYLVEAGYTNYFPKIDPDKKKTNNKKTKKNIFYLLDRSLSMKGERIELLKQAMLRVIKSTNPDNFLSLIAFDSFAEEIYTTKKMGNSERFEAASCINNLKASGFTNFENGYNEIANIIESNNKTFENITFGNSIDFNVNNTYIIFFTDGEDNDANKKNRANEILTKIQKTFGGKLPTQLLIGMCEGNESELLIKLKNLDETKKSILLPLEDETEIESLMKKINNALNSDVLQTDIKLTHDSEESLITTNLNEKKPFPQNILKLNTDSNNIIELSEINKVYFKDETKTQIFELELHEGDRLKLNGTFGSENDWLLESIEYLDLNEIDLDEKIVIKHLCNEYARLCNLYNPDSEDMNEFTSLKNNFDLLLRYHKMYNEQDKQLRFKIENWINDLNGDMLSHENRKKAIQRVQMSGELTSFISQSFQHEKKTKQMDVFEDDSEKAISFDPNCIYNPKKQRKKQMERNENNGPSSTTAFNDYKRKQNTKRKKFFSLSKNYIKKRFASKFKFSSSNFGSNDDI